MDSFFEQGPFGIDFSDDRIKQQISFLHQMISKYLSRTIPAQPLIELYLLKTFRDTSPFVHEASTPEIEMQALFQYIQGREPYIQDFLDATNATFFQTNQEA